MAEVLRVEIELLKILKELSLCTGFLKFLSRNSEARLERDEVEVSRT